MVFSGQNFKCWGRKKAVYIGMWGFCNTDYRALPSNCQFCKFQIHNPRGALALNNTLCFGNKKRMSVFGCLTKPTNKTNRKQTDSFGMTLF